MIGKSKKAAVTVGFGSALLVGSLLLLSGVSSGPSRERPATTAENESASEPSGTRDCGAEGSREDAAAVAATPGPEERGEGYWTDERIESAKPMPRGGMNSKGRGEREECTPTSPASSPERMPGGAPQR